MCTVLNYIGNWFYLKVLSHYTKQTHLYYKSHLPPTSSAKLAVIFVYLKIGN